MNASARGARASGNASKNAASSPSTPTRIVGDGRAHLLGCWVKATLSPDLPGSSLYRPVQTSKPLGDAEVLAVATPDGAVPRPWGPPASFWSSTAASG